ncbi:MAG: hydroxyacid dehydrogenase [Desulfosarcinaceae bacterium]
MEKQKVIICDAIAEIGIDMLKEHCQVDLETGMSEERLKEVIPAYHAAVVRSATKFPKAVIDCATHLKVIGRAGAGLDTIDVAAAEEKGIAVVNSPNANSVAVAEHVFALMLALVRHLPRANAGLKDHRWEKKTLMGTGLAGKTLGLVGFGRIARQVASRAIAFGMQVQVCQRRATPEKNAKLGVETVDLKSLFKTSDFISLHIPGKPENHDLVSNDLISCMKPDAYLINTARGAILDEKALLNALVEERIAGAALDVFKIEPATDNPLIAHERVIATPHVAASTDDAQQSVPLRLPSRSWRFSSAPNMKTP